MAKLVSLSVPSTLVLVFLAVLCPVLSAVYSGRIKNSCEKPAYRPPPDIVPPRVVVPRPDYTKEGLLYGEEVITGRQCFTLEVYPHRRLNTFHISLIRHDDLDVCKRLEVKGVEFLALAHYNLRKERKPFGRMFLPNDSVYDDVNFICGHKGATFAKPIDEIHVDYNAVASSVTVDDWEDCRFKKGGFVNEVASNSIRLQIKGAGSLGQQLNMTDNVVACALWAFDAKSFTYPANFDMSKAVNMEFIAEISVSEQAAGLGVRSVSKISRFGEDVIKKFPPKLICRLPKKPTAPTTKSTITAATTVKNPTTISTGTIASAKPTATPGPVDVPCLPHAHCSQVDAHLTPPTGDLFTSFYDPVLSDSCKCAANMKTLYTIRKYKYGGIHYGLSLPPSGQSVLGRIPDAPANDPIFKTCLQFYFDMSTNCAVFIMNDCTVANPTVTSLELYEFHIFALASRSKDSVEGLPFGAWCSVDESVGNCGNLITGNMKQLYTRKYLTDMCPLHGHPLNEFGMPQSPKNPKVPIRPKVLRNKMDPSLELAKSGQSYVYATRLHTLEFNSSNVTYRPDYITFVLEAVTTVTTKYNAGASTKKIQLISMKTPIAYTKLTPNGIDLKIEQIPPTAHSHPLAYMQLDENWHDHMHLRDQCPHHEYEYSQVTTQPLPQPAIEHELENTCKCFAPLRPTTSKKAKPTNLKDFIIQVSRVVKPPTHTAITEDCFLFGHLPVVSVLSGHPSRLPSGCVDKSQKLHRALVYFGLRCPGSQALEVMDMTILALSHKGYPVGFWENIDFGVGTNDCKKALKANSASGTIPWQIRAIKPIWDFTCPPYDLLNEKNFDAEETFLHDEQPHMLLFNRNLTIEGDPNRKNYGYCAWWYFQPKQHSTHITRDPRNFYFDFQFVATLYIEHKPSRTTYLVTLRQDRCGFNTRTCEIDKINPNPHFKNIYLSKEYYKKYVGEATDSCIIPISQLDTFATGLCGCFIKSAMHTTYRLDASKYPLNHTIPDRIKYAQQCISFRFTVTNSPQDYSVVVSWKLEESRNCLGKLMVYEILLQAIDNEGLPTGTWEDTLISGGKYCERAIPNAYVGYSDVRVGAFSCPISKLHKDNLQYKTDFNNINIFHFRNVWKDDERNWICARWRFPKSWAISKLDRDLPHNFQFYSQAHVYDKDTKNWFTTPKYTLQKLAFHKGGKFTKKINRDPSWHPKDFNNYLAVGFQKESDPYRSCVIKYPEIPPYRSYMCKMFHPSAPNDKPPYRVDTDDEYNYDKEATRYRNCYTFKAYPGNWPLTFHLSFRQHLHDVDCPPAIHFALTAYNEMGFPIGKSAATGGDDDGWTHYDHPFVTGNRLCEDEDVKVDMDSLLPVEKSQCPSYIIPELGLLQSNMSQFYTQQVSRRKLPGMIALAVTPTKPPEGLCFHWIYDQQPAGQITPKFVQFYLEFFVPFSHENTFSGTEFVLRSKKFSMNYKAGSNLPPPANPPKKCHDEYDRNRVFEAIPIPYNDKWTKMYNYSIYPNKLVYRQCWNEYSIHKKACLLKFKEDEKKPIINPIVIIPGILGPDEDKYIHRYNETSAVYDGCVAGKLCFSPVDFDKGDKDSDCISEMNCQLLWAVGKQPIHPRDSHLPDPEERDEFVLELYAATRGWVAMGLSLDKRMGEDFVLECVKNVTGAVNENDTHRAYFSWNIDGDSSSKLNRDNRRYAQSETEDIARLVLRRHDENSVYCVFYIQSSFQVRSIPARDTFMYDLRSDSFCILTAYGDLFKIQNNTVTGIASHISGKWKGSASCRDTTDLSKRLMPTRSQVRVFQYHGVLMTVTYLGLLCSSVFVARYYKYSLTYEIYSYPSWVWIHGILALAASILAIVAWVFLSIGKTGWISPLTSPFHKFMGYNTLILTLINIPLGFYIRKPDSSITKRSVFYMIHGVGGHFALVVGILIVTFITHVEYAFVGCDVGDLAAVFTLIYVIINCVMSCNRYWLNKMVAGKVSEDKKYKLTPFILVTQTAPQGTLWHKEYPKARIIRIIILCVVLFFILAFTIPIVYSIETSDHSCILEKHFAAVNT